MSNIYIQEPPTNGKVLLKTTVGDIDIELWSKETPKASRNFIQLCLEGYYDGTIFHRVIPNFIAQGGDPEGTGEGGESIYGYPFKDEFHSRLRFVRRGLVAMANAGPSDNGSQFFFTLGSTPELAQKHSIFGKVTGNTIYNMLKLQEVSIGPNDRPYCPPKITSTEVLSNPFDDIVPRQLKRPKKEKTEEKKNKSQSKATKNFNLLSFGEEAEEDEVEVNKATKDMRGKSKSSHDLTDDPKLSATPAIDHEEETQENEDAPKISQ
ncbi:spliceosome-associated protein CWC27 homolog isoform X2 [Octopus vulgaris]|uniref:Peptidyl-prolyl cis-trans isomerase n=1 Tax=Octopus vulgaris TaxID=6645 RepID=A0AA36FL28_OCTVU|nr:spliceosome-associated protein CWC27 homolog isoform X2 [Octopus vulgaris]